MPPFEGINTRLRAFNAAQESLMPPNVWLETMNNAVVLLGAGPPLNKSDCMVS